MLKVVQIIPDDRDMFRQYDRPEPFFGPAPTALLEGFSKFPEEVEVHVLSCVRKPMPAPEKLAENIFYHQVPVRGGYRRTLFVEAICKIRGKIREIDPDIVQGQGTEDYPGLCAAFSGYPNCITIHGNMRTVARRLNYRPFPHMVLTALAESVALRKTDAVICNSSYTERRVDRLNSVKLRVFNAVRSSFFEVERSCANERTLLCIGDVLPYKNQLSLICALDELSGVESLKLLFIGKDHSESRYGQQVLKEIASRKWCEWVGQLEVNELKKQLSRSAGVVHPTLEDSFGLAVAEAQAVGVPVAASNVGGLPDLIDHGKTGLLFNPHDPSDIQNKVMQLLDGSISEKLTGNARIFAETEYRPQVIARKHLAFYSEFLISNSAA